MTICDLIPKNGRKSFYGKAKVLEHNGTRYLISYSTIMGAIDAAGKIHRYSNHKSYTTCCHVRSFFPDGKAFWNTQIEPLPALPVNFR